MVGILEGLGLHVLKQALSDVYRYVKAKLGFETKGENERLVEVLEKENESLRYEKKALREEKESLQERLDEKQSKVKVREEKLQQHEEQISQYDRILDLLERKGISRQMLVERYDESIWVILMYFGHQNGPEGETDRFIKRRLKEEYNAEHTAMGMYVIPPRSVPETVRNAQELKEWIREEIYPDFDGYSSIINFAAVLDLRDIYSRTDYTETKGSWKTVHQAIDFGRELGSDGFIEFIDSSPISPVEPVQDGDIAFFASRILTGEELEALHENQKEIEDRLGNPSLRELADRGIEERLSHVLGDFIAKPEEVAESIVSEAMLLHDEFNRDEQIGVDELPVTNSSSPVGTDKEVN